MGPGRADDRKNILIRFADVIEADSDSFQHKLYSYPPPPTHTLTHQCVVANILFLVEIMMSAAWTEA